MTRRDTLRHLAAWAATSPLVRAQTPPETTIDKMVNVFDFDPVCKEKVPKASYDYVSGASWDEWTMRRNREAFQDITFRPRMLVEVDKLDLSTELFGKKLAMPVMVAPTGTHILLHPDAELATARGAGAAGAVMVVSTTTSVPLAKLAEAAKGPLWFQLYSGPDKDGTREKVENAVALGCQAICWTVDTPYEAPRERDIRNNLERAPKLRREARDRGITLPSSYGLTSRYQAQLGWSYLPELVRYSKVPVLVKGILTAEDAKKAVARRRGGSGGLQPRWPLPRRCAFDHRDAAGDRRRRRSEGSCSDRRRVPARYGRSQSPRHRGESGAGGASAAVGAGRVR